jgi:hypothetical protein
VLDLYCGKRHAAGFNVQAVSDLAGRLVDTGLPVPGARHDSKALAESGIADRWASHLRPGGPGMLADLGYLGTAATTGTRKPPKADLTDVQRACNKAINSARAAVERAIAHLVNWKVLDTGWRGRLTDFPDVLRTVTALEIYRTWDRGHLNSAPGLALDFRGFVDLRGGFCPGQVDGEDFVGGGVAGLSGTKSGGDQDAA